MDGSADAPPTEVAATVVPFFFFFEVACILEYLLYSSLYPRHPQFPKYTYLEMGGCIYAYIQCIYSAVYTGVKYR